MEHAPEGTMGRRLGRWPVRAIWVALLVMAWLCVWSYIDGGTSAALSFTMTVLIFVFRSLVKTAVVFAVLSLVFSAWPGQRSFWLGTAVTSFIPAVPVFVYTSPMVSFKYLVTHSTLSSITWFLNANYWLEPATYVALLLVVTAWIAPRYFPKVDGWRLVVFLAVTVAVGLLLPAGTFMRFYVQTPHP